MTFEQFVFMAIEEAEVGEVEVCVVVNEIASVNKADLDVLTLNGIHVIGAFEQYHGTYDVLRLSAIELQRVYGYNVDPSGFAIRFLRTRLRSRDKNATLAMQFYYGQ